jgi:hypothetical protein
MIHSGRIAEVTVLWLNAHAALSAANRMGRIWSVSDSFPHGQTKVPQVIDE